MQPYSLKNSPRSTLLLLLRGGRSQKKVNDLYIGLVVSLTIAGVWYLYPEPKNESYSSTTQYNLWYEENIPILR